MTDTVIFDVSSAAVQKQMIQVCLLMMAWGETGEPFRHNHDLSRVDMPAELFAELLEIQKIATEALKQAHANA